MKKKFELPINLISVIAAIVACMAAVGSCQKAVSGNRIAQQSFDISKKSNALAEEALGISEKSNALAEEALGISEKSNALAKKTFEGSKEMFLAKNRPFLTITPSKFKGLDSYIKASIQEKEASFEFQFKVKNVGSQPATNIRTPEEMVVGGKIGKEAELSYSAYSLGALGPGESVMIGSKFALKMEENVDQDWFANELKNGITIQMYLTYSSELKPEAEYVTVIMNKISESIAIILKSEMT